MAAALAPSGETALVGGGGRVHRSLGEEAAFDICVGRSASARVLHLSWRGVDGGKATVDDVFDTRWLIRFDEGFQPVLARCRERCRRRRNINSDGAMAAALAPSGGTALVGGGGACGL
jgi:hypothetical protein